MYVVKEERRQKHRKAQPAQFADKFAVQKSAPAQKHSKRHARNKGQGGVKAKYKDIHTNTSRILYKIIIPQSVRAVNRRKRMKEFFEGFAAKTAPPLRWRELDPTHREKKQGSFYGRGCSRFPMPFAERKNNSGSWAGFVVYLDVCCGSVLFYAGIT